MKQTPITIICPNCQNNISLDEALTHKLQQQALIELEQKHKKQLEETVRLETEKAIKKTEVQYEINFTNIQREKDEEKERNKKLLEQIYRLSEDIRALRRKDEERDIEMKKKILEEENKIRLEATQSEQEKSQFKIKELEKKVADSQKALLVAENKLSQKSQQLQGEVLELDLEKKLREAFIYDEIIPVGKGKQGGDIIQKVRNQTGKQAGIILWETKRANWSPSWLPKLREDGRNVDATSVILVSETLPNDIKNFALLEGIVIVSYKDAIPMAAVLRRSVMQIASAKLAAANKDEKLEMLYTYLQSDTFRHRFEALAEGLKQMENDLESERTAMERIWKKRKIQIERMRLGSARMYGELQGTMGNALPDIKTLELPVENI